jgi:hypothetical protein
MRQIKIWRGIFGLGVTLLTSRLILDHGWEMGVVSICVAGLAYGAGLVDRQDEIDRLTHSLNILKRSKTP